MQNQEEKQVTKHKAKGRPKGLRKQPFCRYRNLPAR